MNLEDLRRLLVRYGGAIRAWALTHESFLRIAKEIPLADYTVLGIPVVIISPAEPEGAIV